MTIKILVLADVHGELERLSDLINNIKERDFDIVLCPGDFTDMFNIPEGYSQMDVAELVLLKLLSLGKPLLCVPGNHDPYDILDIFEEYNVNLHEKARTFKGLKFVGFGGAETPFNTKFEPTEDEIREHLDRLVKGTKDISVLVTHNPPHNTKVDKTETGEHVGSKSVRVFIEKHQPVLAVSAHIHEAGGADKIGKTTVFYPGAVFSGYYGIVKIDKNVECEIKKI